MNFRNKSRAYDACHLIVHGKCQCSLVPTNRAKRMIIESNGLRVGLVEFHSEIKSWAIETEPGVAMTGTYHSKVLELVASLLFGCGD